MNCRPVREQLQGTAGAELTDEARRHIASCPACAAEARARLLLRLGSEPDEGAMLRPGFEQRLRARLSTGGAGARGFTWNGGFERLVRPALAAAAALVIVCAGLFFQAAAPEGGDLTSLVETDPVFGSILMANPDAMFAEPPGASAADAP